MTVGRLYACRRCCRGNTNFICGNDVEANDNDCTTYCRSRCHYLRFLSSLPPLPILHVVAVDAAAALRRICCRCRRLYQEIDHGSLSLSDVGGRRSILTIGIAAYCCIALALAWHWPSQFDVIEACDVLIRDFLAGNLDRFDV